MFGRLRICISASGIQSLLVSRTSSNAVKLSRYNLAKGISSSCYHYQQENIQDAAFNNTGTTYVEEEVAKFRSMANEWWDPNGPCKPLHTLNKLRVAMIRDGLIESGIAKAEYIDGPTPLKGLEILDVGCGGGILCEPLARLGASVVGLDAAQENIEVGQLHTAKSPKICQDIEYVYGTIEEHVTVAREKYDAVIASEVLEHVEAVDLFISTCAEAVKPGGSMFITTINKTSCSWVGAIAIAEYALHLLPPGTHDWNKFIPRQELLFVLEKYGFITRLVHGMGYNPLTNDWSWQSNTSINYAVHGVKEKIGTNKDINGDLDN